MSTDRRGLSKQVGSNLEADVIERFNLRHVPDSEATWHDGVTVERLDPSAELPFGGVAVIEPDASIDVKGALVERSNGDRTSPGQWFFKRAAHDQLLEDGGHYLLVVYAPRPDVPQLARLLIPASLMDEHLRGRWYEYDGDDRSEKELAQLSWTNLIDQETVRGGGE